MQNQPIRVLYIDDSPDEFAMIRDFLMIANASGYQVDWASSFDTAAEQMLLDEHDIYMIDYNLGDRNGIDLVRAATARGTHKPMIVITGRGDWDVDVAAMEAGASDYLDKTEIRPSILERAVRNAIERSRAFAALSASEERYRELFENTTDLISSFFADNRLEYCNTAWRETLGYNEKESLKLTVADIVHPDYLADCMKVRDAVMSTGESRTIETIFVSKGGRQVIVEGTISCRLIDGKVVGIHGMYRDITARKQAEEALRYQATLLENVSDAVVAADMNFDNIHMWNAAAERMYGWKAEEVLGKNTTKLLKTEFDNETREEALKNFFKYGFWSTEITQKRKDGSTVNVHSSLTLIKDSQGNPISIVGVNRDITERKQVEIALRESERRFRGLFEQTNDAVFLVSLEGQHIAANQRAADMVGYTVDELLQMSMQDIIAPSEQQESLNVLKHLLAGLPPPPPYERTLRRRNGEEFPVEINVELARDVHGKPLHIQSVIRDISARKEAERIEREQRAMLKALLNVAEILNSTLDFEEVLELILANVEKVVPHDTASVMIIENGIAKFIRAEGYEKYNAEALTDISFVVAETPSFKYMYDTQQPVIISDVHNDPNWIHTKESRWIRSYAAVPIVLEGQVIGFLNLDSSTPDFFTPSLLDRLQAFSNQIAVAVKNARHYDQAKQLAAAEERTRLANDLHDAVSQTLFSASLIAETLPRLYTDIPDGVRQGIGELHHLSRQALAEMRSLLLELRPMALEETDIEDLLAQLVETFSRRERINVNFKVDGPCNLPVDPKVTFYRVAQEALNNIGKHAHASQVDLGIKRKANIVQMIIWDDGSGFDPSAVPSNHFGVRIMHERATKVGAHLDLVTGRPKGTKITLTWPSG
ncbi:MAG: PAS domain S-box protein [Anaerolineae bacterium]